MLAFRVSNTVLKWYSTSTVASHNTNHNNIFHKKYNDSPQRISSFKDFAELSDEARAIQPIFADACERYITLVTSSMRTVLSSKNSEKRAEAFYNLIKSCNDENLPELTREHLWSLKSALNDNKAFVGLDLSVLEQDISQFDLSGLNLGAANQNAKRNVE